MWMYTANLLFPKLYQLRMEEYERYRSGDSLVGKTSAFLTKVPSNESPAHTSKVLGMTCVLSSSSYCQPIDVHCCPVGLLKGVPQYTVLGRLPPTALSDSPDVICPARWEPTYAALTGE
ncbi:jg2064 [Pararge aegeria aegeria]|uniref:Jg2064 protein n=1 Tax=Pararge aegeria aegeria TaxID=348720 RepID=A0A8S4RG15_9NEOP|nr:jg2064 [Pararge aegeria aegeria]